MKFYKKLFLMLFFLTIASFLMSEDSGEDKNFSIVSLNIWHDKSNWPNRLEYIIEKLKVLSPDVICLQEVLQNPTLPNQAKTLANLLLRRERSAKVYSSTSPF